MVLVAVHLLVLVHLAHWKISGTTLTPVEPSEAMQTLELGYLNAGFVLFVLLTLATLVLGRFFCGWACHVVAYQDLASWLLRKVGLRVRPVRSRLLVWVPFGAAFYMFAWPQVLRWMRAEDFPLLVNHFLTQNFWETFPGPGVAALTFLVDGFLIVYFLGAKGFCTYGCPYGAVFNLADRVAAGRIRVTDACEGCAHCTATCTSNVHVAQEVARYGMVVDAGCMKCMDCVNVCPKEALYFGFGTPSISTAFAGRRRKIYDFSWKEELLLALAFLAALYAFRGLYNLIPFLLALGLGVLAAVGVLVASRLCLQKQVNFQFYSLRQQGNLTRAGWIATFVILPFLVFAAHSGAVQFHTRHGASLLHQSRTEQGLDAQRDREAARRSLDRAERWGLLPDNNLQRLLAGACRDAQDYSQMEVHLRRAIAVQPDEQSLLALSHLQFTRGDLGAARGTLEALLELDPNHEVAAQRLQTLKQMQDP